MNPFDNNKPNLSASELIRNKRDRTIYNTEKTDFQSKTNLKKKKNINYYRNGKIRNIHSYKIKKSLARGNVLCNNIKNGSLCGFNNVYSNIKGELSFSKLTVGNNNVSEFWGGGGWSILRDACGNEQTLGISMIQSDISGTWNGTKGVPPNKWAITEITIGGNTIRAPFGYANNVLNITRNPDGQGVVLDPSGILNAKYPCLDKRYNQRFSKLKTYITITGTFPVASAPGEYWLDIPEKCDGSNNYLLEGSPFSVSYLDDDATPILSGRINKLCCLREQLMFGPGPPPKIVAIFKMHVELFKISDFPTLSKLVNVKPMWNEKNLCWNWPDDLVNIGIFYINFDNIAGGESVECNIESFGIYQGLNYPYDLNQTRINNTKQNYLFSLEDGTKKINFSQNITNPPISNSYCSTYYKEPGRNPIPPQ